MIAWLCTVRKLIVIMMEAPHRESSSITMAVPKEEANGGCNELSDRTDEICGISCVALTGFGLGLWLVVEVQHFLAQTHNTQHSFIH